MLKVLHYHSLNPGKKLTVFGAIHGNEKCGTAAINKVTDLLDSSKITLTSGTLTFVPVCNPRAYQNNIRFVERDLNRQLYPKNEVSCYEDLLDPVLCNILKNTDILLDLHSYQSPGDAFCFLGTTNQEEIDFALALGINHYIYGWADAFSLNPKDRSAMGTTEFTREHNGIAATLECGTHLHPYGAQTGYEAIINTLTHFNMLSPSKENLNLRPKQNLPLFFGKMQHVFYKYKAGHMEKDYQHFDYTKKGEILARFEDGDMIKAPQDGFIIIPKGDNVPIGQKSEWFYYAYQTDCPKPLT